MDIYVPFSVSLLLCLWYGSPPADAGLDHTCYLDDRRPAPGGICGSKGPMILSTICGRGFRSKRSVDYIDGGPSREPVKFATSKRTALSYLGKRSTLQGFTCECCFNRCSIFELREYCQNDD